ncbi:hypothetical protein F5Y10DRAFT_273784 [Nemania abortiva]|nr:hypothetical protein F5Y10DRAFT_273784 [Nemania abortiva]
MRRSAQARRAGRQLRGARHFLNFTSLEQAYQLYLQYRGFFKGRQGWNKALTSFNNVHDINGYETTIRKALARGLYMDLAMSTKAVAVCLGHEVPVFIIRQTDQI